QRLVLFTIMFKQFRKTRYVVQYDSFHLNLLISMQSHDFISRHISRERRRLDVKQGLTIAAAHHARVIEMHMSAHVHFKAHIGEHLTDVLLWSAFKLTRFFTDQIG